MNAPNRIRTAPLALALAAAALAACTVGPDYERPPLAAPAEFRGTATVSDGSLADRGWWELVDDEALRQLVEEALERGFDVRLAAARVEEARALAGIARAERFPAVSAGATAARGRESRTVVPGGRTGETYTADLGVAWEVDLWGRVRRLNEAALAEFLATAEAARAVRLALVAEVADGYFRLRSLDRQLEIARRTAAAFRDTRKLFGDRLEAGLASSLETSSAEASLATTEAAIPDLERRIAAQENALALLVGRAPSEIRRGLELERPELPEAIPAGLPSDLLARRPDLRRAEQELVAANAAVGVAVADYFPRLSLTAALGGVAPEVGELFGDGERWSVGGGLLSPVLQGGRLRAQHRAALARREQATIEYERAVTTAFAEVSTALVDYAKLARVERELARAVGSHREAVETAGSRYRSGLSGYLEVLQAQQQLFPAEVALAETRQARLSTLVELYRALGGGWQLPADEWTRAAVAAR